MVTGSCNESNKIAQTHLHTKVYYPKKFGCSSVYNLWVLEGTRFSGQGTDARKYILKNCNKRFDILQISTIYKNFRKNLRSHLWEILLIKKRGKIMITRLLLLWQQKISVLMYMNISVRNCFFHGEKKRWKIYCKGKFYSLILRKKKRKQHFDYFLGGQDKNADSNKTCQNINTHRSTFH